MLLMNWPWIWLLLPLPWLLLRWRRHHDHHQDVAGMAPAIPPGLAAAMQIQRSRQQQLAPTRTIGLWLIWLVLLAALSQPYWLGGSQVRPASGRAMMLAIDLSGSMEKRDFEIDGQTSQRITAVKKVAQQFARSRRGDRIGLVLFADQAYVGSPLTFDVQAVAGAIAEAGIGMVGRTTAIGDALGLAIVKLRSDAGEEKAIILLSDGTNNAGTTEPEDAAALAVQFGIRIHTIALTGRAQASSSVMDPAADLDEATLQAIAKKAGGQFHRATTGDELLAVYDQIAEFESSQTQSPPLALKQDLRRLFELALLVLLIASLIASQISRSLARWQGHKNRLKDTRAAVAGQ